MHTGLAIKDPQHGKRCSFIGEVQELKLQELLDAALAAEGTNKGNIQLFDPKTKALHIVAHRGFDSTFLKKFETVRPDDQTACGRAFRLGRRVMIEDVTTDPYFQPFLSIARASGYRAVQSTPIMGRESSVIGVLSTHFAAPHHWPDSAHGSLDEVASQIGNFVTELVETY